jgi:hypothetical protein
LLSALMNVVCVCLSHSAAYTIVTGVGGETGWGVVGEALERALATVGGLLDATLVRLQAEMDRDRHKTTSVSANVAAGAATSTMSAGNAGGLFSNSGSHNNSGTSTPLRVASD